MTVQKYPLSAANGRAIPSDVFGAVSYNGQAVTTSELGTLIQDANFEEHLLHIFSSIDLIITFSADDTLTGADTEIFFIPASTPYTLEPMQEYYSIKGDSTTGTAHINTVRRYDTLGTETQTDFG